MQTQYVWDLYFQTKRTKMKDDFDGIVFDQFQIRPQSYQIHQMDIVSLLEYFLYPAIFAKQQM